MSWQEQVEPSRALIRWAARRYGDRLAVTSAFGLNGVALIHLVYGEEGLQVPVLFVDTGYLFPETLVTCDRLLARYGFELVECRAREQDAPEPRHPDCCQQRKVAPMRRALEALAPAALLTGRAWFQAATRQQLPLFEEDRDPVRINPLVRWTQEDVEHYVREHDLPYNPLYDQGYLSIGCRPCTRPVAPGEHIRAGRWDGLGWIECGLWA